MSRTIRIAALVVAVLLAGVAAAQSSLFYKELARDGTVYVFNTPERLTQFLETGEFGTNITMTNQGPNGETVVAENETALDLYNFKHDRPGYERPAPKLVSSTIPTTLRVADGGLKFGLLLQGWYVADGSPVGSGSSFLGNATGNNTFRLRRSEIKLSGRVLKDWGFEVMFDPAKGISPQTSGTDGKILQDLAVSYLGFKGHELSLGQKKIAMTEEGLRSSSEIDFAERALFTRTFSDRRETGFFYKGEYGEHAGAMVSITNGTAANVLDDSNDTLFFAARVDAKPAHGLLVGASGGFSGGEGAAHLTRNRLGAHLKWDGPEGLPLAFRAEYMTAKDGQSNGTELRRDGFYGSLLYTIANQYRLAVRYDVLDRNKDASASSKTKTITGGFHWMIKGKNANLKLEWYHVKDEGRRIADVLEESYDEVVLAAQIAF